MANLCQRVLDAPEIVFNDEDLAQFADAGRAAYLPANQVRLADMALAQEGFALLLSEDAPDLEPEISRFDAGSGDPLRRELFPVPSLAVNGWWVDSRVVTRATEELLIDAVFAASMAHADFYVALALDADHGACHLAFRGWISWERLRSQYAGTMSDGRTCVVPCVDLDPYWQGLLEALGRNDALERRLEPYGTCGPQEGEALAANVERLLDAPEAMGRSEYDHWLTCSLCQQRAIEHLKAQAELEEHLSLAAAALAAERGARSVEHYRRALELAPGHLGALRGLFDASWQNGAYGEALSISAELLRAGQAPAPLHRARAALYHLSGEIKLALAEIRLAMSQGADEVSSLLGALSPVVQPVPAWAYAATARTGSPSEVVVVDSVEPNRILMAEVRGPQLRATEDGSSLALLVRGLSHDLAGRHFRILILSRELETAIENLTGQPEPGASAALWTGGIGLDWFLALSELALLRNSLGEPVEGVVSDEGVIDLVQSLPSLLPEALEAKTVLVYLLTPTDSRDEL